METIHETRHVATTAAATGTKFQQARRREEAVAHPSQAVRHTEGADTQQRDVDATPQNVEAVKTALEALEQIGNKNADTRFQFQVHDKTGKIQVQLVNYRTGEVVEEVPSKKLLDFATQLEELTGLVLEERA